MLLELARPFSYLSIRHGSKAPLWINAGFPLLVAVVIVLVVWAVGFKIDVFGTNGMVSRVQGFAQGLPGFYIAALAAIATFSNPDMDRAMPGESPKMAVMYNGGEVIVKVTRRRFLSVMFSYLTACSLMLTMLSVAALSLAEPLTLVLPQRFFGPFKAIFCTVYLFLIAQLIFVTLWGLFYLGERIHTPDS